MSINVAEIPQIDGDLDAVDSAGKSLKSAGKGFAETGSDVHSTWQGLSGVYRAPESGELLSATAPVSSDASTVGSDVSSVGSALSAYAAEVKPIKAELEALRAQAMSFNSSIAGDDDWEEDEDKVNEKNGILKGINAQVAAWQAAERTCANAINATYGGVQYRADDGEGEPSQGEYGYSAEMLDGATAGEEGVPWGKASEVDKPWYEDVVDGIVSFGKGLVVDGLWGAVRGLGTMVGVDGWDAMKQAWGGIGKLALALNPVTAVIDQTVGLPGMERGEAGATALAAGKALIAYDMWGQDPARAAGAVTGNVLGAVIGTKGAGMAVKGAGAAVAGAKATGQVGTVVGKGLQAMGNVSIKAGELSSKLTGAVTAKAGSFGQSLAGKIQLPTFGPQPAFAVAGGSGGRAAMAAFDTPAPTRTGSSAATQSGVFAARIDDTAPGGRSSGTGTPPSTTGVRGGGSLVDDATPATGRTTGPAVDADGTRPVTDPGLDRARSGAAAYLDDAAASSDDLGSRATGAGDEVLANPADEAGPPPQRPFSGYADHRFENRARGQVGEDLSRAQRDIDGETITGEQVRLYVSPGSNRYAMGDFLARRPEGNLPDSAHVVEAKTGTATLTENQKLVYPKLEDGGPKVGSTTNDPTLVKGREIRPGDISSSFIERWAIDNLPTSIRDQFSKPARIGDIYEGKFGPELQQALRDWMAHDGNRVIEMIERESKIVGKGGTP